MVFGGDLVLVEFGELLVLLELEQFTFKLVFERCVLVAQVFELLIHLFELLIHKF